MAHNSNRSTLKCPYCKKPGHQETECWKKHPHKAPSWIQQKNNNEIAGFAVDGETAFMSLSDVVPVETVNEDNTKKNHKSDDNEPPPLRERKGDLHL